MHKHYHCCFGHNYHHHHHLFPSAAQVCRDPEFASKCLKAAMQANRDKMHPMKWATMSCTVVVQCCRPANRSARLKAGFSCPPDMDASEHVSAVTIAAALTEFPTPKVSLCVSLTTVLHKKAPKASTNAGTRPSMFSYLPSQFNYHV